jgi:hypothetical protein
MGVFISFYLCLPQQILLLLLFRTFQSAGNIQLSQDDERYGLSIVKASPKETGEYSCSATNEVGTAKCAAQLIVKDQEIAPKIVKGFEDVTVDEGKGCTLESTITGKPQTEVTWTLNGKNIEVGISGGFVFSGRGKVLKSSPTVLSFQSLHSLVNLHLHLCIVMYASLLV